MGGKIKRREKRHVDDVFHCSGGMVGGWMGAAVILDILLCDAAATAFQSFL